MTEEHLRLRDHAKEELAFYSKATTDFEYLFPFGWGELWGVADRTDYDLKQHQEHSGQPMEYIDPETNERYHPLRHRALAGRGPRRRWPSWPTLTTRKRSPTPRAIPTPASCCICTRRWRPSRLPCCPCRRTSWARPRPSSTHSLRKKFIRRLRRDRLHRQALPPSGRNRHARSASPWTSTLTTDGCVTVRDRDTMQQERIAIADLEDYIAKRLVF